MFEGANAGGGAIKVRIVRDGVHGSTGKMAHWKENTPPTLRAAIAAASPTAAVLVPFSTIPDVGKCALTRSLTLSPNPNPNHPRPSPTWVSAHLSKG